MRDDWCYGFLSSVVSHESSRLPRLPSVVTPFVGYFVARKVRLYNPKRDLEQGDVTRADKHVFAGRLPETIAVGLFRLEVEHHEDVTKHAGVFFVIRVAAVALGVEQKGLGCPTEVNLDVRLPDVFFLAWQMRNEPAKLQLGKIQRDPSRPG